jgi:hypothetical protein
MFWLALILLLLGIGLYGTASYLYTRSPAVHSVPAGDKRVGIAWLFPADPHAVWGYLALASVMFLLASLVIVVVTEPHIPVIWK